MRQWNERLAGPLYEQFETRDTRHEIHSADESGRTHARTTRGYTGKTRRFVYQRRHYLGSPDAHQVGTGLARTDARSHVHHVAPLEQRRQARVVKRHREPVGFVGPKDVQKKHQPVVVADVECVQPEVHLHVRLRVGDERVWKECTALSRFVCAFFAEDQNPRATG